MKTCLRCGGELRETVLEHYERWPKDMGLVVFEQVPAQECMECGEAYFDAATSKKMEEIIAGAAEPKGRISVPIYSIK
jgi:YgiT-type zinc finger domain-containing protein